MYRQSAAFRQRMNGVEHYEPTGAEVFDEAVATWMTGPWRIDAGEKLTDRSAADRSVR